MNRRQEGAGFWKLALALVNLASMAACGSSLNDGAPLAKAHIELQSNPVALYDAASGKTTVVLEFLVRDGSGRSVDPATTKLQRFVDDQATDVESVPNFQDTKLASSLRLGLVLDASYSMTTWQPPAFQPMKQAALDTQTSIRAQFSTWNSGTFTSFASWFQDQYVCVPSSASMPDSAVLDIPTPKPGDATKLYAATAQMVDRMKQMYDANPGWSSSDHFALVVFTDGWDNYSWHDDTGTVATSYLATGGSFSCAGPGPMALADLIAKLQAFPQLKVHVIGLGNAIHTSELSAVAAAGRGRFVSNPDSGQVSSLFQEITREFTTVRRDGITMPLPPGDYEYLEQVSVGGATASVRFRFHAGDASAAVNAASIVAQ